MKYLMLFEAFETKAISKVYNFINKKLGSEEAQEFLKFLRKAQSSLDFPLDKISDKDIEYLNAKKALKIDNKEKSENEHELYCLKFWFSLDNGFIGVSGIGNYTSEFEEDTDQFRGDGFTEEDIEYVKNELNIKTGKLKRLFTTDDYASLNHGDYVIANLNSDVNQIYLSLARVYLRESYHNNQTMFAITDNTSVRGGDPGTDDWINWGSNSWNIGENNRRSGFQIGDDHRNMYKYIPGDDPLEIIEHEKVEKERSPFEFNLPFNSSFKLRRWSNYMEDDWSFQYIDEKEHFGWEKIEKSDFCIVLYLDDLLKESKPSETSKQRRESRKGATYLMSNDEIKKANIERYLSQMLDKMGISKDTSQLKNLQKYIKNYICGDYSFLALYVNRPSIGNIQTFQRRLFSFLTNYKHYKGEAEDGDKEYWKRHMSSDYDKILRQYKTDMNDSRAYKKRYISNYSLIMKTISENQFKNKEIIKEFYTKLKSIGDYINEYFSKREVSTISEFLFIYSKLSSISDVVGDDVLRFSNDTRSCLMDFRYENDQSEFEYYLSRSEIHIKEDLDKLKEMERFIKSILN